MALKTAIVTGAGGYLGISICKRLVDETNPSDRLLIVVTSRTFRGATQTINELRKYADSKHAKRPELIEFDYLLFDQCNMVSVTNAAREINLRYKHIDYFFFNSSHSQMGGIDYKQAFVDFFTRPLYAFTVGTFKIQGKARKSADGIGACFQANVFAPYYLVHEIMPRLENGGKLIWISSSISVPEYFDLNDLGVEESMHSYEASKYELELLHLGIYKKLLQDHKVESWLLQPGVFKSTTFVPTLNVFMYVGMLFMFYLCRWMGSPYHCIYPDLAANAPLFLALKADTKVDDQSIKYGSSVTRSGKEKLMKTELNVNPSHVSAVVKYIENLRQHWKGKLKNQVVERENF